MEPLHEFGKEAREMEMARQARLRRNKKRALSLGVLLVVAVAAFAFRDKIGAAFSSSTKETGFKTASASDKKKDKKADAVSAGVSIVKKWDLPKELLEISGLSWMDHERFACVQDEKGIVFIYNTKTNAIEKQIPFSDPGDYEGLALVGEMAWVIRSDGKLYEISSIRDDKPSVKTYDTPLTAAHNTEGLCYDKKNNRLLVAIKEDEPGGVDYKGIYAFDLAAKKMDKAPVMKIDLNDQHFAEMGGKKKKAKSGDAIMPSAIAVHPLNGDIYITEGRNPKLLIATDAAVIRKLYLLDKNQFVQPEGITFSPEGELFISNEGTKQPGNILKVDLTVQ